MGERMKTLAEKSSHREVPHFPTKGELSAACPKVTFGGPAPHGHPHFLPTMLCSRKPVGIVKPLSGGFLLWKLPPTSGVAEAIAGTNFSLQS